MIRIYFFDRVMLIAKPDEFNGQQGKTILRFDMQSDLKDFVLYFEASKQFDIALIINSDPVDVLERISSAFKFIEAAGGLVKKQDGTFLAIERLGVWDLPKGKIDAGENPLEAAIREIEEECGVSGIRMISKLQPTFHTYRLKDKFIVKKTHWFEFHYNGAEIPTPQLEEDITQAGFYGLEMIPIILKRTYPSIRDVIVDVFPDFKK